MEAYLFCDKTPGMVTEGSHEGWIRIQDFSLGVMNPCNPDPHGDGELVATGSHFLELAVSKDMDPTSPLLSKHAATGEPIPSVKVHVVRDASSPIPTVEIELSECFVTQYSVGGGGEKPLESVSFSYAKIMHKCTQVKPDGSTGESQNTTFNLITHQCE